MAAHYMWKLNCKQSLQNKRFAAEQSFRRIMQAARRDYNQEFWWKPGEVLPERGPDLGAVTGK
jgi:hypothetical protein